MPVAATDELWFNGSTMGFLDRYRKSSSVAAQPGRAPVDFDDRDAPSGVARPRPSERRCDPRLVMPTCRETTSDITVAVLGRGYRVQDLSARGFSACLTDDTLTPVTPTGRVTVTMQVETKPVELVVELRHCTGTTLGFEIVHGGPAWPFTVARLLGAERLGQSLRALPLQGVVSAEFGGVVHCYGGGPVCSLWVWCDAQGREVAARLFFGDDVVEWFSGRAPKSGRRPPSFAIGPRYGKAEALALRSPAEPLVMQLAQQILSHAKLSPGVLALTQSTKS